MATENEEGSLSPRLSRALGAAFSEYHTLTVKETIFLLFYFILFFVLSFTLFIHLCTKSFIQMRYRRFTYPNKTNFGVVLGAANANNFIEQRIVTSRDCTHLATCLSKYRTYRIQNNEDIQIQIHGRIGTSTKMRLNSLTFMLVPLLPEPVSEIPVRHRKLNDQNPIMSD